MLEFQDIRAGNQVLVNSSGVKVTIAKVENNEILLNTIPHSSLFSNEDISGIPLTTAMLRKLSFENEDANVWAGEGITIRLKEDGIFYGLRISKSRAKLQYLHQLQNYISDFYALFREEEYSLDVTLIN